MDDKKIAFIISTNNEQYLDECIWYIEQIKLPVGMEKDIITIREAESMCSSYNAAMNSSNAKYKIYLHQDCFIINIWMIFDLLKIFEDPQIGMVGAIGRKGMYPKDAKFHTVWDCGKTLACNSQSPFFLNFDNSEKDYELVSAIDGMFMATQYDLPWNENFDGWHFYDIAQSITYTKQGYRIAIPCNKESWIMHDAGYCGDEKYDLYRKKICDLYPELFTYTEEPTYPLKDIEARNSAIEAIDDGDYLKAQEIISNIDIKKRNDTILSYIMLFLEIRNEENVRYGYSSFTTNIKFFAFVKSYNKIKFILRRIEYGMPPWSYEEIKEVLKRKKISVVVLMCVLRHSIYFKDRVVGQIEDMLKGKKGNKDLLFDQYQRYHTIADIINLSAVSIGIQNPVILEVGANVQKNLGKELPNAEIFYTDLKKPVEFSHDNHCFEADATNLIRIGNDAYDYSVASDVFEHIPPELRTAFIEELWRVSKYGVVLCFPYCADKVEKAEKELNLLYKQVFGIDHRWLIEHIDNGLPKLNKLEKILSEKGMKYSKIFHGEIGLWEKLTELKMFMGVSHECDQLIMDSFAYYNTVLYKDDIGLDNYRVFYILHKDERLSKLEYERLFMHEDENKEEKLQIIDEVFQAVLQQILG